MKSVTVSAVITNVEKINHSQKDGEDLKEGACEACRPGSPCAFPSGVWSVPIISSFIQNGKESEVNPASEDPIRLLDAEDFQHFNLFRFKSL